MICCFWFVDASVVLESYESTDLVLGSLCCLEGVGNIHLTFSPSFPIVSPCSCFAVWHCVVPSIC